MGFKPWGNLCVLLLASAALVGCNNTPQKDKSLGAGPKIGDQSIAKGQPNKLPDQNPNALQPFPLSGNPGNPLLDSSRKPFSTTSGPGLTPDNRSFTPVGGSGVGGTPGGPLPQFPPMFKDNAPPAGNGGVGLGNTASPLPQIPNPNLPLGSGFKTSPAPNQPGGFATDNPSGTGNAPKIDPPANWRP